MGSYEGISLNNKTKRNCRQQKLDLMKRMKKKMNTRTFLLIKVKWFTLMCHKDVSEVLFELLFGGKAKLKI